MSYRFFDHRLLPAPSPRQHHGIGTYPMPQQTFPLSQVETDASALARERGLTLGKVLLALVVIAIIVLLVRKLAGAKGLSAGAPVRNPVNRLSTQVLAKKLYERLDARGTGNPDMMRSLAAYSKPKARP